jgi:hypothetical protein
MRVLGMVTMEHNLPACLPACLSYKNGTSLHARIVPSSLHVRAPGHPVTHTCTKQTLHGYIPHLALPENTSMCMHVRVLGLGNYGT